MTPIMISCISVGGAGVLVMLISVLFFQRAMTKKKCCPAQTMGTVISYKSSKGKQNPWISPVVEYYVDGERYTAYRHYKGVVASKRTNMSSESFCDFYISKNDWFHKSSNGTSAYYSMAAMEKWPKGTQLPVVYNPQKPKQAYVEKVVVVSDIVGIVLLSVGFALVIIAGLIFFLC